LQELEETEYWLELLGESGFFPKDGLAGQKRNGRVEGNIRQHRKKHQS
jgi:hypothetical protein